MCVRYLSHVNEDEITEFVKIQLTLPGKLDPSDELSWQHHLYSTLGNKKSVAAADMKQEALELLVQRILAMGKVLYGLHSVSYKTWLYLLNDFNTYQSIKDQKINHPF